jgi:hypothetical protein
MPATVDGSLRSPLNIKLLGEVRRTRMETDGTDAVDSKFACSKKTVSIGSRRQKDQLTESVSVADYKLVGCRGDMLVNDLKFSD